ncbi:hypothetical protein L6452_02671 [Arctium lappa]|uniref:Uncharacterized protein n=1 Tax=Arctium lappa TaxID=4217 RepID=A0ACB9FLC5_ARCLA|nr:hypothetical protein L6452_02671 [Arctium lappa]
MTVSVDQKKTTFTLEKSEQAFNVAKVDATIGDLAGEKDRTKNQKSTRTCSIYADRPYFCRVESDVFEALYGIDKRKFNKEACST